MPKPFTFGIVGGSGAAGKAAVSALHKSASGNLLIGGRDLSKAEAVAAQFDARVTAAELDVLDSASLERFCSECTVILNCSGPVCVLQDRVAQAAFRNRCHYVDPAGLTFVKEAMLPHSRAIADAGLCFVISAGWMPGLSELLPVYGHACAKAKMDTVESITVYSSDCGDWSRNALLDAAWFLHKRGLAPPGYFHKGVFTRVKSSAAMRTVALESPLPSGRFGLYFLPEMEEVGRRLNDCDFFSYSYVSGTSTILASMALALFPLPESLAVRMVRSIFRRNRFAVGGFVRVEVRGRARGQPSVFSTSITFEPGREYWVHGTTLATVARLVAESKHFRPGVHYLADAVDPVEFFTALGSAGILPTANFDFPNRSSSSR